MTKRLGWVARVAVMFVLMIGLYIYISGNVLAGSVAAVVMLIVGFFFATVSGAPTQSAP